MGDVFVARPLMPPIDEYFEEVKSIWETKWLTNVGHKHNELEKKLCDFLGGAYVGLVVNGHAALELAIQAYGIEGEIITTPFTFVSTANAICRVGAKPVFCDICENNYTIDPDKIEKLVTTKTKAILPVHVYGNICYVDEIKRIADKYGLKVIYDAAHAFGVRYRGKPVSCVGDSSCYSFHATKVFNTIEGGAVCTNNYEIYKKICVLRDFGINGEGDTIAIGGNAKMNEFSAAMGICNLRHISDAILYRKAMAELYDSLLEDIPGIRTNTVQENVESNYSYYPIIINPNEYGHSRDDLFIELQKHDIWTRKYFYPIITEMPAYKGKYECDTPIAKSISEKIMTLPMHDSLSKEDVGRICEIIRSYYRY